MHIQVSPTVQRDVQDGSEHILCEVRGALSSKHTRVSSWSFFDSETKQI